MQKTCWLCCTLIFFTLATYGQAKTAQQKLDSLILVKKNYLKEDSIKYVILRNIMVQYGRLKNQLKTEESAQEALLFAAKFHKPGWQGAIYYRLSINYHGLNNYLKAEENYYKSIAKYTLANDLDWVAGNYQNLGALYTGIPDYVKALEANQKAIVLYNKLSDEESAASCYANIGVLYNKLAQQSKAVVYLNRGLKEFLKDGEDNRGVAIVYEGLGNAYLTASNEELNIMGTHPNQRLQLSLAYFQKALKVAQFLKDELLSGALYQAIGNIHEQMSDKTIALNAYQKAIAILNGADSDETYGFSLLTLGKFYFNNGEEEKALPLLTQALAIGLSSKDLSLQRDAHLNLSLINEQLGSYSQSLANYRKYISFRDLIFDNEKEKEITRRRLELDFTIKEKDYQLKQQVTDGELQRQVLLLKQRQQELALSDKEKSLQRLTFLKKQSDLENEKRFQQEKLDQQQLQAKLDAKEINLQKSEISFNRKINMALGVLVTILLGTAIFVFYSQRKTAKLNKIVSEQKQQLETLGQVKDRIFSVVSHDMRAPVNSLISFIQLLEDGDISQEKLNRYAAHLKNTLGYTSNMMENLLNWASSQMEGYRPVLEKFDIELCTKEVINSLTVAANQKCIKINNEIKSGSICLADMNMTSLVLRNLLSNAIKFTPNQGVIKISALATTNHVMLNVADNGIGLTETQIFRFNQPGYEETGESTLGTNKEKGTGIGLVLCKTFTNLMNGNLQVKSTPNKGSVFTLQLPKSA